MAKRKSTGKRQRFNIFKRDKFTCQYCGGTPPTVVLVVDHIVPVAAGGPTEEHNLITSCEVCNQGKADGLLSDVPQAIDKTLAAQVERQEQLAEYNKFLLKLRKEQDALATDLGIYWCNRTHPDKPGQFTFGPDRMTSARTFLKRLPAAEIYDAIDIAFSRRPPRYKNDNDTFKYFCGICWAKIKERGGS
jgi:hypothetical protein